MHPGWAAQSGLRAAVMARAVELRALYDGEQASRLQIDRLMRGPSPVYQPEVRVFEIGKNTRAEIEAALGQVKANFNLDSLRMVAQ